MPRAGASELALTTAERAVGARKQHELKRLRVQKWQVPPGKEKEAAARLVQEPAVEWAQPNYVYHALAEETSPPILPSLLAQVLPNDPYLDSQWGLKRVRAPDAWMITRGDPSVTVAVVDTGLDFSHPDKPTHLMPGFNFIDPNQPPNDDYGHGTRVTGIIAAATDNSEGIAGVAPEITVMELKVLDSTGQGTEYDVAQALDYAASHGARIVNLSLGGSGDPDDVMCNATAQSYASGLLLVAAAGNSGPPPIYPAACPGVLAVGATDDTDAVAYFSVPGSYVSLAAPGVYILSTTMGGDYGYGSGTSFASPHVAGAAALIWSAQPSLSVEDVATILKSTAQDIGDPGWDQYSGWGRLDAKAAIDLATKGLDHLFFPLVHGS